MALFGRRLYGRVARQLRDRDIPWSAKLEAAHVMADVFADDDGGFDRDLFLKTCGVIAPQCAVCGEPDDEHLPGCALVRAVEAHPAGKNDEYEHFTVPPQVLSFYGLKGGKP